MIIDFVINLFLKLIILWCDHVTVIALDNSRIVFSRGTWKGFKGIIPKGGHIFPVSRLGAKELWKKLQKNLIKKKISDTINKIIPHRSPEITIEEWNPWNELSREISRHHCLEIRITNIRAKKSIFFSFKVIITIKLINKFNIFIPIRMGHGLL